MPLTQHLRLVLPLTQLNTVLLHLRSQCSTMEAFGVSLPSCKLTSCNRSKPKINGTAPCPLTKTQHTTPLPQPLCSILWYKPLQGGQALSAGGALQLDVHPALQAARVEKVAAGGDHAGFCASSIYRRHADHTLHPSIPSFDVSNCPHIPPGDPLGHSARSCPEVVVLRGQEPAGDEAPRPQACLSQQHCHLYTESWSCQSHVVVDRLLAGYDLGSMMAMACPALSSCVSDPEAAQAAVILCQAGQTQGTHAWP